MKKLLLILALACSTVQIYGQLYVTPNGSSDSYVFVKDRVLYVEQDINLVANNAGTTEASIYLRDEAQLIQGTTGTSTNTGTGSISIYQDSNSDSYDYNFWSSPVGRMTGSGNQNAGLVRLNDSLTYTNSDAAVITGGYNGASSPLTIARRWIYKYIPSTQRWSFAGWGDVIPAGYGFTMKGTGVTSHSDPFSDPQNQRYDFRGRPHDGNITMPVETTGVTWNDGNAYYFTLTGNPYPSALDLYAFMEDSDNDEIDSINYWDEDRSINSHLHVDNKGGYATWIPGPGPVTTGQYTLATFMNYDSGGAPLTPTGDYSEHVERRYAPVGQGFMVRAIPGGNGGDGNIVFKNSHRTYVKEGATSEFRIMGGGNEGSRNNADGPSISTDGTGSGAENNVPRLRIHAMFGEEITHFRDMLLMFHETATDAYDRGLDATHPMDGARAEAYFPMRLGEENDYRNFVMQTVPFDNMAKMVPIAFKLTEQQLVRVTAALDVNTPFDKAYLYDSSNNSYQEITNERKASVLLPAGTYEGRFFITFRGAIGDDSEDLTQDNLTTETDQLRGNVQVVQNNTQTKLEVNNPELYNIAQLTMYDMAGRLVMTQNNVGNLGRYSFPTSTLSDGVYMVMITTKENIQASYKVSVFNK